ncbi:hypothetical protein COMA2_210047 [Candidatus Nitrospira nitrificans]|uniref:Uncharacterized protein n=1 Tax=Candidatus Nitrospira nitrificans TaxID=1742973 RepID=A0A0S4LFI3_9BACT|nr:hypothetical protein COMA2_210047 [Candidatus Nitrospira nitrificans]
MSGGKARGGSGSMHRMPVHNQIDPAVHLLEQPLHEFRKDGSLECTLKHHKGERTLVRDGRDHVAPEALPCGSYDGSVSHRRIACPGHVVTAQPHFVAPINGGVLPLGLSGNHRVFLFQPPRDGHLVPLIGASHRLLRAHPPRPEVAPHGDQRDPDPIFPRNQTRHRSPRPEIERQLQLIGQLAHDQTTDVLRLRNGQPAALATPTPPGLRFQGAQPSNLVDRHPLIHRTQANAVKLGRLSLRTPAAHRSHGESPEVRLRRWNQGPGIVLSMHSAGYYTTHYLVN